jgi:hypothetical protein
LGISIQLRIFFYSAICNIQVIQIRIRIYLRAVGNPKIINQGYHFYIYVINKTCYQLVPAIFAAFLQKKYF